MNDVQKELLLWVAQTEDGLMADDLTPGVMDGAVELWSLGLLRRGEPIGDISVFHISELGLAEIGVVIH